MLLTLAFVVLEAVAGYFARAWPCSRMRDTTLPSGGLGPSWTRGEVWQASDPRHDFGFHRVGILAALLNSAALVVVAVLISGKRERSACVSRPKSRAA